MVQQPTEFEPVPAVTTEGEMTMTDILGIIMSKLPDGEWMDKMQGLISRLDKSDPDYDIKLGVAIECMRLHWSRDKPKPRIVGYSIGGHSAVLDPDYLDEIPSGSFHEPD